MEDNINSFINELDKDIGIDDIINYHHSYQQTQYILLKHLNDKTRLDLNEHGVVGWRKTVPVLLLKNGTEISVQASSMHSCNPRINFGMWTEVEARINMSNEKIPKALRKFECNYDGIMNYVPIDMIISFIIMSGGIDGSLDTPLDTDINKPHHSCATIKESIHSKLRREVS